VRWINAARPFSLTASLVPVVLGGAMAAAVGSFHLLNFLIVLVGGVALQIGTNLTNDAWDVIYGIDRPGRTRPNHAILDTGIPVEAERRAGLLVFAFTLALGIWLAVLVGWVILIPVVIGAIFGHGYTAPPLRYKFRGWSLPAVFVMMGPLMVWAAAYGTGGSVPPVFWWASVPVGLLVVSILHVNDMRDMKGDAEGGVHTFAGAVGSGAALRTLWILLFVPYLIIVAGVLSGRLPAGFLAVLLTLPLALGDYRQAKSHVMDLIDARTAQLHLAFGVLLTVGVLLQGVTPTL